MRKRGVLFRKVSVSEGVGVVCGCGLGSLVLGLVGGLGFCAQEDVNLVVCADGWTCRSWLVGGRCLLLRSWSGLLSQDMLDSIDFV